MLNSIIEKNLPTIVIFYFKLQSYSTHSPEFTGLKFEIKFLFICGYIFFWIRIQEKVPDPASSGSTTVQKYQAFFPTEKGKCLCRTALYSDRNKQFPAQQISHVRGGEEKTNLLLNYCLTPHHVPASLLEKCWRILLYVTDDAIAKYYVT